MALTDVVMEIDRTITQLQEAKKLLAGMPVPTRKGRTMSASARKRIAKAQKARWANYHKEHGKK